MICHDKDMKKYDLMMMIWLLIRLFWLYSK